MDEFEPMIETVCSSIRGHVINYAVFIERLIDELISRHFCDDPVKKKDLMELIICESVQFDVKRNVFEFIASQKYPSFKIEYPSFKSDVIEIMTERNVFAHWMLDTSKEGQKVFNETGEFRLIRWKNYKTKDNVRSYTSNKTDELFEKCDRVISSISKLLNAAGDSNEDN